MNRRQSDNGRVSIGFQLPPGHNTVNGFIVVEDAARFLRFLCEVFDGSENTNVRTPDRDGTLIHAEARIGTSTIMVADKKPEWPGLHALTQVYVTDAHQTLDRAVERGARVVTDVSPFYGGVNIARFIDPWNNLWWLYEPSAGGMRDEIGSTTDWHAHGPSYVYQTLMDAMQQL